MDPMGYMFYIIHPMGSMFYFFSFGFSPANIHLSQGVLSQRKKKTRAVPVAFPGFPDVVEERRGGLFAATTLGTAPWGVTGLDDYLIATPGSSRYPPKV